MDFLAPFIKGFGKAGAVVNNINEFILYPAPAQNPANEVANRNDSIVASSDVAIDGLAGLDVNCADQRHLSNRARDKSHVSGSTQMRMYNVEARPIHDLEGLADGGEASSASHINLVGGDASLGQVIDHPFDRRADDLDVMAGLFEQSRQDERLALGP